MKIAIVGRSEILYEVAKSLNFAGHKISCILTATEASEYTRTAEDFKSLAESWDIPFSRGSKIEDHYDFLRESGGDIAVSINFTGVVPKSIIDLYPLGILNAHGGDLPRYRGNACQAWAILNGEERIGLCIHKMIGGELDSGDIIARDYMPIDHTTKITYIWEWMRIRTPELMVDAINNLAHNSNFILEQQSKNIKDALRCYPRQPDDARIDWKQSSIEILWLVNASNRPYSGAFCDYEGRLMRIWDANLAEDSEVYVAVPGQVTAIADDYIVVACGSGKLKIHKIQLDGECECSPSSFITSIRKRLA